MIHEKRRGFQCAILRLSKPRLKRATLCSVPGMRVIRIRRASATKLEVPGFHTSGEDNNSYLHNQGKTTALGGEHNKNDVRSHSSDILSTQDSRNDCLPARIARPDTRTLKTGFELVQTAEATSLLDFIRALHYCVGQNLLLQHHGRVADLILCKGAFTEANELNDEMQTLKGYGVKGAPRGFEPPVVVPLFYDFKPVAYDEPLLLVCLFFVAS